LVVIGADYVVRRRRHCDHFVMMCVCVGVRGGGSMWLGVQCVPVYVSTDKTKTADQNDLKLGTVVVLDSVSQPTGFVFKMARVRVRESASICISR